MITPAAIVASPGLVTQNYPVNQLVFNKNNFNKNKPIVTTINPVIRNTKNGFSTQKPFQAKKTNLAVSRPFSVNNKLQNKKFNNTLSRTDAYLYLTPDIQPITEQPRPQPTLTDYDSVGQSWMPYVNKKFFTTLLPSSLKYKNHWLQHSPTTIKYVYKKHKGEKKRKKKKKKKKQENHSHSHSHHHGHEVSEKEESWFHGWNPFSCEESDYDHNSKELVDEDEEENSSEDYIDDDEDDESTEYR